MKKIIAMALALVLVAGLSIGGTVAYFSDTESQTNTFTLGNVNIAIDENFTQNSLLVPGRDNLVPKEVYIKNTGTMEAWVWYTITMPAAYETSVTFQGNDEPFVYLGYKGTNWDAYNDSGYYDNDGTGDGLWHNPWENQYDNDVTMWETFTENGVEYIRYTSLYLEKLPAGETTQMGLAGVYQTSLVTQQENADGTISYYVTDNDENVKVDYDFAANNYKLDIVVDAYAIQDNNYADVYAAWKAYNN